MSGASINFLDPANRVATADFYDAKHWLEESIWGHRLWHRQSPWLLFLEMLNVAASHTKAGRAFGSQTFEATHTLPARHRLVLRYLLFRNAEIDGMAKRSRSDAELWPQWISYFDQQQDDERRVDVSYLRQRFPRFKDFAAAVKLLRETTVYPAGVNGDSSSERRWTSFFVFPFGDSALYEDLNVNLGRDASRFGRTGDILFQMLARSKKAPELVAVFASLLNTDQQVNKLVAKLQDASAEQWTADGRRTSYLPYRQHPRFDRLAEDWLHIHSLKLARYDAYQHYVTLAALHLLIYQMETAAAWSETAFQFVCEIHAPKPEAVRRLSIESFQRNEGAATAALQVAWNRILLRPELAAIDARTDIPEDEKTEDARDFLHKLVNLPDKAHTNLPDRPTLFASVWAAIESKAEDNLGQLHRSYGRACGLVSRRGAAMYRYAPTDAFLKTLVLANVPRRMELREFLALLRDRYHLAIGPNEVSSASIDSDRTVFEKNSLRLQERLRSMGMLNRLSDGVAFVENPNLAT